MASMSGRRGRLLVLGAGVLVLGAGGVWAGKYWAARRAESDLHATLAAASAEEARDALLALEKDQVDDAVEAMKGRSFSEMREMMRSGDLTDEQRQKLRDVMREVGRAHMNERVDEYFAAAEEQREALLDRHIDEMMEMRERWRAEREQRREEDGTERERPRREPPTRNLQDAKERMEGGDPDQQKRMTAYWGQMRARMQARGIEGGRGFGGMRGGRGGGGQRGGGRPGGDGGRGSGGNRPGRSGG